MFGFLRAKRNLKTEKQKTEFGSPLFVHGLTKISRHH